MDGHCGPTVDGERGDCDIGDKGWVGLKQGPGTTSWDGAISECTAACLACDRCRFISLSLKYKDCSWYRRCPSLSRQPAGFRTLRVRNGTNARQQRRKNKLQKGEYSRAARDELQKAFSTAPAAKWLTPHAAVKIAFCFFGKIGALHDPSSYTAADSGDAATVRLAHAAFERYVLAASPNAAAKVFVHSWNPSLGSLMDSLYKPAWSAHEAQVHDERVPSAALSLQKVLRGKAEHESKVGIDFELAALMRHDLIFFSPLTLIAQPKAQLWASMQCCGADREMADGEEADAFQSAYQSVRETCYAESGSVSELCRVRGQLRSLSGSRYRQVSDEANVNYWVNDWLLLAPSSTADTFGQIYERLPLYRAALKEVGIHTEWMHFVWAIHIHHAIRVASGTTAIAGMRAAADFTIARLAASERVCSTNVSVANLLPSHKTRSWEGLAERLCPMRGTVACKFKSLRCSVDTPAQSSWMQVEAPAEASTGGIKSKRRWFGIRRTDL